MTKQAESDDSPQLCCAGALPTDLSKHLNLSLLFIWLKMKSKWWQKKFKGQNKLKAINGPVCVLQKLPQRSGTDIAISFPELLPAGHSEIQGCGELVTQAVTEEQLLLSSVGRHCQRVISSASQGQVFEHDTAGKCEWPRELYREGFGGTAGCWTWPVNVCF